MRHAGLIALALLGAAGCERIPGTDAHAIRKGQEFAAALLIDPSSAQFRRTELKRVPKDFFEDPAVERLVCGEINGKNRQGAYVGFGRFLANPDKADSGLLEPVLAITPAEFQEAATTCHTETSRTYSALYERRDACQVVIDNAAEQADWESFDVNFRGGCLADADIVAENAKAREAAKQGADPAATS